MAYSPAQQKVLEELLSAGRKFGASPRELKAELLAGRVESNFAALDGGDRDSTGPLQQRPSQGWGPAGESVETDGLQFLKAARALTEKGFKGSAGEMAQAVQRSAFPDRYDQHSAEADEILKQFRAGGALPTSTDTAAASSAGVSVDPGSGGDQALAVLAAQLQRQPVASSGLAAPAFSAGAVTPQGATQVVSSGGPAPRADMAALAAAAAQVGQDPPASRGGLQAALPAGEAPPGTKGQTADVAKALSRAAKIDAQKLPYQWGGGHSGRVTNVAKTQPLDCSGAVSAVLGIDPRVASQFKSFGKAGRSAEGVNIYANDDHVLMEIRGHFFGTSRTNPGGGAGWIKRKDIGPEYLKNFTVRHVDEA